jgi:DNA-binding transcriptional MerR regulator
MGERIITLFGEEIIPEQIKAVGKSRAKKKPEEKAPEENSAAETAEQVEPTQPKVEEEKTFVLPDDWQGDKQYYSIGEVAELFKVKTSHIRFWTNEFKLKVRTTRKGDRLYSPAQVRELRAIHHLVKERGFTLTGAKAKLKTQNKRDVETIDLKQSLLQLRNKLLVIRNQLK